MSDVVYNCGECGDSASVVDGVIYRACGHDTAPVTAGVSATAYGEGGASGFATPTDANLVMAELFIDMLALAVEQRIREQAEAN